MLLHSGINRWIPRAHQYYNNLSTAILNSSIKEQLLFGNVDVHHIGNVTDFKIDLQ